MPDFNAAYDALSANMQQNNAARQAIAAQESAEMKPVIASANKIIDTPTPKPPKPAKIPAAPQSSDFGTDAQSWVMAVSVLSGLTGALSRQHATTALNAFAAGIDGYKKGNKEAFDMAYKQWEGANKAAIESAEAEHQKYMDVINDRKLSLSEKQSQLEMIASEHKNEIMALASQEGDWIKMGHLLNAMEKSPSNVENEKRKFNAWKEKVDYQRSEKEKPSINQETADFAADQLLAGDKSGLSNYGRGEKATANLALIHETVQKRAKEKGITGNKLAEINAQFAGEVSGQRALGTRGAVANLAVKEMDKLAQPMIDTMNALDPSQFPDWNSIKNAVQKGTGGADVVKANLAVQEFKTAFTNLMVRNGVPTDAARARADELFSTNFSLDQIKGVVDQAKISGKAVIDAVAEARGQSAPESGGSKEMHWDELQ